MSALRLQASAMATDSEIYRAANLLVKEFGEIAPMGAQIKADQR